MKIIQFYILCLLVLAAVINSSSSNSGSSGSGSGSGSSSSGSSPSDSTSDGSSSGDSTSSGSSMSDSSDGDSDKDTNGYPDPVEPERTPSPIDEPEDVLCSEPGQLCCATGASCVDGAECFDDLCIELGPGNEPICGADGTPCCRGGAADPDECAEGLQCETRNGGLFLCVVPGNAMMNADHLDADSLEMNGDEEGNKSVNGLDDKEVYNIGIALVCAVIVCGVFVGGYCWYKNYEKNTRKGHIAVDNQDVDESEAEEVEHGIEEETETGALVTVELH